MSPSLVVGFDPSACLIPHGRGASSVPAQTAFDPVGAFDFVRCELTRPSEFR